MHILNTQVCSHEYSLHSPLFTVATAAPPIQVGPKTHPGGDPRPLQVPGQHHARERGAGPGDPEQDQRSQPGVQVPQVKSQCSLPIMWT